jgi:hypothetical protein
VRVYVFTGPTISPTEAKRQLDAVYLPPVAEGDVYRVALERPAAIGVIDGYFQSVPAVRHKEILWAMSRGIHVFGSASMGAIRAAELAAFGMEGVGRIFEFYRDGALEDDDEVAIAHGPAEVEFVCGSEAMVNIRQTLRKAERLGVISTDVRAALEKVAKELFYPDRSYPLILRCALEDGLPEGQLARLRQWLPSGQVNQKKEDALAMLRLMRQRLSHGLKPKTVSYCFQHTVMWESAWSQCGELRFDSNVVGPESLLNELRLEGAQCRQPKLMALQRFFAIRETERLGMKVSEECRKKAEIAFRRERGLLDAAQLQRWMNDNDLSEYEFDALMMDEARLSWIQQCAQTISLSCLLEQLRLSGDYPRLMARAEAKNRLLESLGFKNPCLKSADLTEDQLLHWYFEELLGRPVPDDVNGYAHQLGFASPDVLRRVLLKEYLYRRFREVDIIASRRVARDELRVLRNARRSGVDRTLGRDGAKRG